MGKQLPYFWIGDSFGGNQDWFIDTWMNRGGCAALTACDSSIYLDRYKGTHLCPFDSKCITKEDYLDFGMRMKPFISPRWTGVDSLSIYREGFQEYLDSVGEKTLSMEEFSGRHGVETARRKIIQSIDEGFPIAMLVLNHANPVFEDFVWHWFLLTGYESLDDVFQVSAATYAEKHLLNFDALWDSGKGRKGGLVLYHPA